jgi:hypothetical protein|tara:strand:+ start:6287 stop:6757 length:471 start_codon:yes stop_codon:yes gene_type:complete
MSSLPIPNLSKKIDNGTSLFFDTYYTQPINFSDNELNAVKSFFETRGFGETAALAVSITLLNQAKNDNIKIFNLLDTLGTYQQIELSTIVAEILNYNRKRTSVIGFKKEKTTSKFESRNIIQTSPVVQIINIDTQENFSSTGFTFDSEVITWDGES